jgi:hypothetical protein
MGSTSFKNVINPIPVRNEIGIKYNIFKEVNGLVRRKIRKNKAKLETTNNIFVLFCLNQFIIILICSISHLPIRKLLSS